MFNAVSIVDRHEHFDKRQFFLLKISLTMWEAYAERIVNGHLFLLLDEKVLISKEYSKISQRNGLHNEHFDVNQ